jgi:8-oxo-dGTP diphosphatase
MEPGSAKVGVGVLVWKGDKIALIKRAGTYGNGTWSPPGGHVEFAECAFETARRETMEEIGVQIENLEILGFTEDITQDKHYITIWVRANWSAGEIKTSDIEFTESGFFQLDELPDPLFVSFQNLLEGKLLPKSVTLSHSLAI